MVVYRYDPAVLIIHVRWHETTNSFGKLLRDLLYLSYAGNEKSVSVMNSIRLPIWMTKI